jgi:hypothetical protein
LPTATKSLGFKTLISSSRNGRQFSTRTSNPSARANPLHFTRSVILTSQTHTSPEEHKISNSTRFLDNYIEDPLPRKSNPINFIKRLLFHRFVNLILDGSNLLEHVYSMWRRLPRWAKISLHIIYTLVIPCLSYYLPPLIPSLLTFLVEEFKISGLTFLSFFIFLVILGILMHQKLMEISVLLREIGRKLGATSVEIKNPGLVYPNCTWLTLSKPVDIDWGKRLCRIHVRCSYPEKLINIYEGCPMNCSGFKGPPQPSGAGAYGGMVIGGLLGLIIAGPVGAILGGLIGGGIGHVAEASSLEPIVRRELRRCEAQGLKWEIYIKNN